jgi:hypothetical protein
MKEITESEIKQGSIDYAKEVLGIEQFDRNSDAARAIMEDFIAGAKFVINLDVK